MKEICTRLVKRSLNSSLSHLADYIVEKLGLKYNLNMRNKMRKNLYYFQILQQKTCILVLMLFCRGSVLFSIKKYLINKIKKYIYPCWQLKYMIWYIYIYIYMYILFPPPLFHKWVTCTAYMFRITNLSIYSITRWGRRREGKHNSYIILFL